MCVISDAVKLSSCSLFSAHTNRLYQALMKVFTWKWKFQKRLHAARRRPRQRIRSFPSVRFCDNLVNKSIMKMVTNEAMLFWAHYGGDKSHAKSFWVDKMYVPNCSMEAFAKYIAEMHCGENYIGAEYWVQHRISDDEHQGLEFHFDKDEALCAKDDVWMHPFLSTATYLDSATIDATSNISGGSPLVIFRTSSEFSSAMSGPSYAWVIFPMKGRHVAFHGDLLHGVSSEILGMSSPGSNYDGPYSRLSFLVNIWTIHKPSNIARIDPIHLLEKQEHYSPPEFTSKTNFSSMKSLKSSKSIKANCEKHPEFVIGEKDVFYLGEHVDGDTAPLPIHFIRNSFHRDGFKAAMKFQFQYETKQRMNDE